MIHELIDRARGLQLRPCEVLEAHLDPGDQRTPNVIRIVDLDMFLLQWFDLPGFREIVDGIDDRDGFDPDVRLVGLIHDDGVLLVAFSAVGVAK